MGQKVNTLNGRLIFISLREYWYYLVLSSDIHVKGDKMKRDNNTMKAAIRELVPTFCPTMRRASTKGN